MKDTRPKVLQTAQFNLYDLLKKIKLETEIKLVISRDGSRREGLTTKEHINTFSGDRHMSMS